MKTLKIWMISIFSALFSNCNGQPAHSSAVPAVASPVRIHRFDKRLFEQLNQADSMQQAAFIRKYPQISELIGKGFLNMPSTDMPGFKEKLFGYYSEPTLKNLYKDAITLYDTIPDIEQALHESFIRLKEALPSIQIPAVYMHVSGFNQNILAADSLLSLSIDKYMGADYPLYQSFFYPYQRRKMTKEHIVPDYLTGWIMAEYPFEGNEKILLERMIYAGKIKYLIHRMLPGLSPELLMGYSEKELAWCRTQMHNLWRAIIERKHLYTPDQNTTEKYFDDAPSLFLADDAPGNLGVWIGWQIVEAYMKETQELPETLMQKKNSQDILRISKFNP